MRLSEIYRSVQGEGPRVGLPTVFVRFAGCNLRCPEWACDTQHAIDPIKYRKEWEARTPEEVSTMVTELSIPGENICLTGGEPFLQPEQELHTLHTLLNFGYRKVECFSNGILEIPTWAFEKIDFVIDWKLPGSGEWNELDGKLINVNADKVLANLHRALESLATQKRNHVVKFTVADYTDMAEAVRVYSDVLSPQGLDFPIYVAPVWGKVEPSELVHWMLDCDLADWRLNLQTHKYIFDPDARRT